MFHVVHPTETLGPVNLMDNGVILTVTDDEIVTIELNIRNRHALQQPFQLVEQVSRPGEVPILIDNTHQSCGSQMSKRNVASVEVIPSSAGTSHKPSETNDQSRHGIIGPGRESVCNICDETPPTFPAPSRRTFQQEEQKKTWPQHKEKTLREEEKTFLVEKHKEIVVESPSETPVREEKKRRRRRGKRRPFCGPLPPSRLPLPSLPPLKQGPPPPPTPPPDSPLSEGCHPHLAKPALAKKDWSSPPSISPFQTYTRKLSQLSEHYAAEHHPYTFLLSHRASPFKATMASNATENSGSAPEPPSPLDIALFFEMSPLCSRPEMVTIYYTIHDLIEKHYPDLAPHLPSHQAVAAASDAVLRAMVYIAVNDLIHKLRPSQTDLVALYQMDVFKKCWVDSGKKKGWREPLPNWNLSLEISEEADREVNLARQQAQLETLGEAAGSNRTLRPPNKKQRMTETDDDVDIDMSDVPENVRTLINESKNCLRQVEKDQDQLEFEHNQMAVILKDQVARHRELNLNVGRTMDKVDALQTQSTQLATVQGVLSTRLGINTQHLKILYNGLQQQHNVIQDLCMQQEIQLKADSIIIINYDDPNDPKPAAENFLRTIALPDVEIIKAFITAHWMPNSYNAQLRHLLIELPKSHMVGTAVRCFQQWRSQQADPPAHICRPALTDTQQVFRNDIQSMIDWWRWWFGKDYRWRPDLGGHVIEKIRNSRDRQVSLADLISCQTTPTPTEPAKGPEGKDARPPAIVDPDAYERVRQSPQFRMNCLARGSKNWRQMMTTLNFQLTDNPTGGESPGSAPE